MLLAFSALALVIFLFVLLLQHGQLWWRQDRSKIRMGQWWRDLALREMSNPLHRPSCHHHRRRTSSGPRSMPWSRASRASWCGRLSSTNSRSVGFYDNLQLQMAASHHSCASKMYSHASDCQKVHLPVLFPFKHLCLKIFLY